MRGQERPRWSAQNKISGGSKDTEANDWQAKPTGSAPSRPVITVTPLANMPIALRNSAGAGGSITGSSSANSAVIASSHALPTNPNLQTPIGHSATGPDERNDREPG